MFADVSGHPVGPIFKGQAELRRQNGFSYLLEGVIHLSNPLSLEKKVLLEYDEFLDI
jgi:hypothetical protein